LVLALGITFPKGFYLSKGIQIMADENNGFNLDMPASQESTFNVGVIVDADGNDTSGFTIVGKNSSEYQDAARAIRIAGLKRSSKRKNAIDMGTDEGAAIIAKVVEDNELALAMAVVKDWFGFKSGGVTAVFSKDVASGLLVKYPTWREKIAAALEVDANFLKG
jgi:hypothetical protein